MHSHLLHTASAPHPPPLHAHDSPSLSLLPSRPHPFPPSLSFPLSSHPRTHHSKTLHPYLIFIITTGAFLHCDGFLLLLICSSA